MTEDAPQQANSASSIPPAEEADLLDVDTVFVPTASTSARSQSRRRGQDERPLAKTGDGPTGEAIAKASNPARVSAPRRRPPPPHPDGTEMPPIRIRGTRRGRLEHVMSAPPALSNVQAVTLRMTVPIGNTVLWEHVLGDRRLVTSTAIEERAKEIAAVGQRKPCRGRRLDDDRVEIVAGVLEFLAVEQLAAEDPTIAIVVDIEPMSDLVAFQIAHAEAAEGIRVYAIDRALFLKALIDTTGMKGVDVAAALGVHASTVSRLLDVLKTKDVLGPRITDFWTVSADQSDRFMKLWNDKPRRSEVKVFIATLEPNTARRIFAAVRNRFGTARKVAGGSVAVRGSDGQEFGSIARSRSKDTVIRLSAATGDVELVVLMEAVTAAMNSLRNG